MSLTIKQRAKVNAALCIINDAGHDAGEVNALARTIMATGHDARTAYERAINSFSDKHPDIAPVIGKMTSLVEASCPRTVAQYDQALSHYIETGNDSALVALAPTIAEDSIALAIKSGEITEADAAEGGLPKALGFEPGGVFQQALSGTAREDATPASPASATVGLSEAPPARDMSSQVSPITGNGMVAPKAQRAWADSPYVGMVSATPALHGLNPNAAREAAKAAAMNNGRAVIEQPGGTE